MSLVRWWRALRYHYRSWERARDQLIRDAFQAEAEALFPDGSGDGPWPGPGGCYPIPCDHEDWYVCDAHWSAAQRKARM